MHRAVWALIVAARDCLVQELGPRPFVLSKTNLLAIDGGCVHFVGCQSS